MVERLAQAFEQTADVLELLAASDKVAVEQGLDPTAEVSATAAELRAVAVDSEQLGRSLANPASALFLMGGRWPCPMCRRPKRSKPRARPPVAGSVTSPPWASRGPRPGGGRTS